MQNALTKITGFTRVSGYTRKIGFDKYMLFLVHFIFAAFAVGWKVRGGKGCPLSSVHHRGVLDPYRLSVRSFGLFQSASIEVP